MKNKIALRNHLKVDVSQLKGQAKKNNQGKAAAGLVGRKRAARRVTVFHQKSDGKRKPEESKMARKRRRKIRDRRRMRKRLFVEN